MAAGKTNQRNTEVSPREPEAPGAVSDPSTSRWHRLHGRLGLVGARFRARARYIAPRRMLLGILGVALAITMLAVVTGLAIGIAGPVSDVGGQTYWIVPESSDGGSLLVAAGDAQFGLAHEATEQIRAIDGVRDVTPVLVEILRLESAGGQREYVAVVGVIPGETGPVLGIPTEGLSADQSHYANGTYDGEWTGEAVFSQGAASLLKSEIGSELTVETAPERTVTVEAVANASGSGLTGTVPVALVHLAELQTITGAANQDQADRFMVRTDGEVSRSALASVYEKSSVVTSAELGVNRVLDSDLSLALAGTAVIVALLVGGLFVATTMVLEVVASARQLWTLQAIGIGRTARVVLFGGEAIVLTAIGGIVGGIGGYLGSGLLNRLLSVALPGSVQLVWYPSFVAYGLGVALLVGILTVPVLAVVIVLLDRTGGGGRA